MAFLYRKVEAGAGHAWRVCAILDQVILEENAFLFLNFSYLCPEPVLVKWSFLALNWCNSKGVSRTGVEARVE